MVFRSRSTEYGDADSALLRLARSRMLARRLGDPSREAENIFHELKKLFFMDVNKYSPIILISHPSTWSKLVITRNLTGQCDFDARSSFAQYLSRSTPTVTSVKNVITAFLKLVPLLPIKLTRTDSCRILFLLRSTSTQRLELRWRASW